MSPGSGQRLLGVLAAFVALHSLALHAGAPKFAADRVLVRPNAGLAARSNFIIARGHKELKRLESAGGLRVIQLRAGESVADAVAYYQSSGAFAEPDYVLREAADPDDPNYVNGVQWGLRNIGIGSGFVGADIHASAAWDVLNDTGDVVVAIVDGGARLTHEDILPNLWTNPGEIAGNGLDDDADGYKDDLHGLNAINPLLSPVDERGHGTHVAGIAGAAGNNGVGVSGVAWKTRLMILKFLDANGNGTTSDAVECLDYARAHGARVINASWSGGLESFSLRQAMQRVANSGIVFSNAAGNESENNDITASYPGEYALPNMLVVAATTRKDGFDASYSNYGKTRVHLAAPGTSIYSTSKDSDQSYAYQSGTSMSCAFVTGAAALVRARFPDEDAPQIVYRLISTVDQLPDLEGRCVSGGRLNLKRALGPSLMVLPESTQLVSVRAGQLPPPIPEAYGFTNLAPGAVRWFLQSNVSWLRADLAEGVFDPHAGGRVGYSFTQDAATLAPGSYRGRLSFSSDFGTEPVSIRTVELRVLAPVRLDVLLGAGNTPSIAITATGEATLLTEASFDLVIWSPVQTNQVFGAATLPLIDEQQESYPRRFYRVRVSPP